MKKVSFICIFLLIFPTLCFSSDKSMVLSVEKAVKLCIENNKGHITYKSSTLIEPYKKNKSQRIFSSNIKTKQHEYLYEKAAEYVTESFVVLAKACYFKLAFLIERIEILRDQYKQALLLRDMNKRYYDIGMVPENYLLFSNGNLAISDNDLKDAEIDLEYMQRLFQALTGISPYDKKFLASKYTEQKEEGQDINSLKLSALDKRFEMLLANLNSDQKDENEVAQSIIKKEIFFSVEKYWYIRKKALSTIKILSKSEEVLKKNLRIMNERFKHQVARLDEV